MRKYLSFLLLTAFLISCNNENEPQATDKTVPVSVLTKLNFPDSIGSSGDATTSILGYGYDATGFCDSVSVKAKVLDMSSINYV